MSAEQPAQICCRVGGSTRKEGVVTCDLYAFLTTEANAEVAPIHPKAMPVILTSDEEFDIWLRAPTSEALALQLPLRDGSLLIVARGDRQDEGQHD